MSLGYVATMETARIGKLEKRVGVLERELRRVKAELEMAAPADPLNWKNSEGQPDFTELDKQIIRLLLQKGAGRGMTTTEIAQAIGQVNVHSGRVIVWRRLKQIAKKSKARTGYPIVVMEDRSWHMNLEEFTFLTPKEEKRTNTGLAKDL